MKVSLLVPLGALIAQSIVFIFIIIFGIHVVYWVEKDVGYFLFQLINNPGHETESWVKICFL